MTLLGSGNETSKDSTSIPKVGITLLVDRPRRRSGDSLLIVQRRTENLYHNDMHNARFLTKVIFGFYSKNYSHR